MMTEKEKASTFPQMPAEITHIHHIGGEDIFVSELYNYSCNSDEKWAPGIDLLDIIEATHSGQKGIATLIIYELGDWYKKINGKWYTRISRNDKHWVLASYGELIDKLSIIQTDYLWAAWRHVEALKQSVCIVYAENVETKIYTPNSEFATMLNRKIGAYAADQRAIIAAIGDLNDLSYCKDVIEFAGYIIGGQ